MFRTADSLPVPTPAVTSRLTWHRLWALWPYKLAGTTIGMALFFTAYFHVLRHPVFDVTVMPLTRIDHEVTFSPLWLLPYLSLWFYVTLPPSLFMNGRELALYGAGAFVLSVVGLVIFFFWPTTLPVMDIDWSRYPSMMFLKSVDASGNACPSLHVGFAVFTAFWLDCLLRRLRLPASWRVVNVGWALAISVSTLGTKQHVAWDAICGAALGMAVAWLHQAVWRRVPFAGRW